MKRMFVTLAIGAAAMGVLAQPPKPDPAPATVPPPATPIVKKETTQIPKPATVPAPVTVHTPVTVSTPFTFSKPEAQKKVERVDGMSSVPWTDRVGWYPGESAFTRPELRDPSMPFVWVGHEPWQR